MITIEKHLKNNGPAIEKMARKYSESYGVSYEQALQDVRDEYVQGWHEANDEQMYG